MHIRGHSSHSFKCRPSCGQGTAHRTLLCSSRQWGYAAQLASCAYKESSLQALAEPCSQAACPAYYWDVGPWQPCSATCGPGRTPKSGSSDCIWSGHSWTLHWRRRAVLTRMANLIEQMLVMAEQIYQSNAAVEPMTYVWTPAAMSLIWACASCSQQK